MRHAHLALFALVLAAPAGCDGGDDGETTSDSDSATTGTDTDAGTTTTTTDSDGTDGSSSTGGSTGGGSTGGGIMGDPCDFNEAMCGDGTFHCLQVDLNDPMGTCLPPCAAAADCDAAGLAGYGCCTITFSMAQVCIPADATIDGVVCG